MKDYKFGWVPKYITDFDTDLNNITFNAIALKVLEKLKWIVVFNDGNSIEAKRVVHNKDREKITILFSNGKITIESVSMRMNLCDFGANSKRVQSFIDIFSEIKNNYNQKDLNQLKKELIDKTNWNDYKIPEKFPSPVNRSKPQIIIPLIGGLIVAILLGFLIAYISIKTRHLLFIFEFLSAIIIGFAFNIFFKISNYTNFNNLHYIFIAMIFIMFSSSLYFQYQILIHLNNLKPIGFLNFFKLEFEKGLIIEKINIGQIGLIISFSLQIIITYIFGMLILFHKLTNYKIKRVPNEIIDFTYYLLLQNKTEIQIKMELSKIGWKNEQNQDEVFEALGAIYDTNEMKRY